MALRGHASIQGSTDIPTLYDLLPGYLPCRGRARTSSTLEDYIDGGGADARLVVALRQVHRLAAEGLVRRRGDARRTTSASRYLPKITGNHSHFPTMLRALDGGLDGCS